MDSSDSDLDPQATLPYREDWVGEDGIKRTNIGQILRKPELLTREQQYLAHGNHKKWVFNATVEIWDHDNSDAILSSAGTEITYWSTIQESPAGTEAIYTTLLQKALLVWCEQTAGQRVKAGHTLEGRSRGLNTKTHEWVVVKIFCRNDKPTNSWVVAKDDATRVRDAVRVTYDPNVPRLHLRATLGVGGPSRA
jgi:hypothetical protein